MTSTIYINFFRPFNLILRKIPITVRIEILRHIRPEHTVREIRCTNLNTFHRRLGRQIRKGKCHSISLSAVIVIGSLFSGEILENACLRVKGAVLPIGDFCRVKARDFRRVKGCSVGGYGVFIAVCLKSSYIAVV